MDITVKLTKDFAEAVRRDPQQLLGGLSAQNLSLTDVFADMKVSDNISGLFVLHGAQQGQEEALAEAIRKIPGVEYSYVAPDRQPMRGV